MAARKNVTAGVSGVAQYTYVCRGKKKVLNAQAYIICFGKHNENTSH
jgi:hypothetical protein